MSGQIVGYAPVSSVEQNPARQLITLDRVDVTFTDTVSGKNSADDPP